MIIQLTAPLTHTSRPSMNSTSDIPGLWSAFRRIVSRDLLVTVRRGHQWLNPLFFFVIVVTLFPLGVGPEAETLSGIAPGVVWVAALLATLLGLDLLFTAEFRDGTLEQMLLQPQPLSLLVLGKLVAHWIVTALPLIIVAPLLGLLMQLPMRAVPALVLGLLPGTLVLVFLGGIGSALTVGVRFGGVLLAILVLPLYVPVLIFGSSMVQGVLLDRSYEAQLSLLLAIALLCISLAPLAIAASLRIAVSDD